MCPYIILSLITDTRIAQDLDKDDVSSPRVRQRKISSSSETGTPQLTGTPKSAKVDDRHFFGSTFSLDHVAEHVANLSRPALGQ